MRTMAATAWWLRWLTIAALVLGLPPGAGAAPGRLDPTFGPAGKITTNVGFSGSAFAAALQPDGKTVVAGSVRATFEDGRRTFAVARYLANGGLDPTFGSGGMITAAFGENDFSSASAVALQTDGKIVVAGRTVQQTPSGVGTSRFALVRYLPDGRLDLAFGTAGKVVAEVGDDQSSALNALALQPDGKIVAAGSVSVGTGLFPPTRIALTRHHPDGRLDLTFGVGGKVTTTFGGDDTATAVAIQPDGKIVAAGSTSATFDVYDFVMTRYAPDGSLDSTFGTGGKVTGDFGGLEYSSALALQPDGRIVVAISGRDFILARYTATGGLDPTFGTGGKVTTDFGGDFDSASAVALQADGRIVVAGTTSTFTFENSFQDFALARYHPDGRVDSGFGSGGKVTTRFDDFVEGRAVAVLLDGRIIVTGGPNPSSSSRHNFALARYNPNGSLDLTFRGMGRVTTDFGGDDSATAVAIQPDGKIVAAAATHERVGDNDFSAFAVSRYHPDGRLDLAFGSAGKVVTHFGGYDVAFPFTLALQPDGKIILAGGADVTGNGSAFALARYRADGALDLAFGAGGKVVTNFGETGYIAGLTVQPDGRIVVAGNSFDSERSNFTVARYRIDGSLDPSFGAGGKIITGFGDHAAAFAVAVQSDGQIVAAGSSLASGNVTFALARYASDGGLDPGFGSGGKVVTDFGHGEEALALALQPDGKIVVAGGSVSIGGDLILARYDAHGSLDASFGTGGQVTTDLGGTDTASQLALQPDGKILVTVTVFPSPTPNVAGIGIARSVLARYTSTGSLDPTFGEGGTVDGDFARGLALQPDGRIVVAGISEPFGGDFAVARYTGDLPTTFIATNQLVYHPGDLMTVAITTDPGLSTGRWYVLVALETPSSTPGDPFFLYRFDPVVGLLTFAEASTRSIADIAARPLGVIPSEPFTILGLTLPPLPAGSYRWLTTLVSEDLGRTSNVATASFDIAP